MKHLFLTAAITLAVGVSTIPRADAQALYSNGPINGNLNAWAISDGYQVADSFSLTGASSVTGVNFGIWNFSGDTATAVDWSITTSPFGGTTLFSGSSEISQVFQFMNLDAFDLNSDTISLGNLSLGAGTYYLQLQNAVASNGDYMYWDENDGSSLAYENEVGPIGSEAFNVLGTPVPEPASLAVLVMGLSAMGFVRRRSALRHL